MTEKGLLCCMCRIKRPEKFELSRIRLMRTSPDTIASATQIVKQDSCLDTSISKYNSICYFLKEAAPTAVQPQ